MVYDKVKALADAKGITIRQLEKQINLTNGAIGKWRESTPNIKNLMRVADALGVSIFDIVDKEEE